MKQQSTFKVSKKIYILAGLGFCIPIFLITMAYIAVKSDQKNQEKYKQQQAEIMKRIESQKDKNLK